MNAVFMGYIGGTIILAWAAFVVWGLGQTTLAAIRGQKGASNYLAGLVVGCAPGVGVVFFVKNGLPFDLVGVGFVLALFGTLFNSAIGYNRRRSDETLQTRTLDILNEFIRKDLVTVSVLIDEPQCGRRVLLAAKSRSKARGALRVSMRCPEPLSSGGMSERLEGTESARAHARAERMWL